MFNAKRKLSLFSAKPKHRAIDYDNLHNPFEVVSASANKGRRSPTPHKSYGYLVQPRLGGSIS